MPSSLMRRFPCLIFATLALPLLAGCAQKGPSESAPAGCPAERAVFTVASQPRREE